MIVLGIDTATSGLGVSVAGDEGIIVEMSENTGLRHSQGLLPATERALSSAGLTVSDLDAVAVTLGPGSFTSVRIGLSTAKGLCMARDLPLVGISSLAARAARTPFSELPVVVWLDAKRDEVYTGTFDTSDGNPREISAETVVAPAEWLEKDPVPALFAGDGAIAYHSDIVARLGESARFAPAWTGTPCAGVVAVLGREKAIEGDTLSVGDAAPAYLRRPYAVAQREA